jgi:hypothetical protein
LRERLLHSGLVDHDHLFFTESGAPIPDVKYPYVRWRRTLRRLAIRYRKPYMARHTSVSWNLMIGRNPLLVAKEHGHRLTTMLSVYAAWTDGAVDADVTAIRDAMNRTDHGKHHAVRHSGCDPALGPAAGSERIESRWRAGRRGLDVTERGEPDEMRFGSRFASGGESPLRKPLIFGKNLSGKGGTRTRRRDEPDQ